MALVVARGPAGKGTISERSLRFWERAAKKGLDVPPEEEEAVEGEGDGCDRKGRGLVWLKGVV